MGNFSSSKLEKALGPSIPPSERFFGLENVRTLVAARMRSLDYLVQHCGLCGDFVVCRVSCVPVFVSFSFSLSVSVRT
jgi:hypothetical protein